MYPLLDGYLLQPHTLNLSDNNVHVVEGVGKTKKARLNNKKSNLFPKCGRNLVYKFSIMKNFLQQHRDPNFMEKQKTQGLVSAWRLRREIWTK